MTTEKPPVPDANKAPQQNVTELSDSELAKVTGGDGKVQMHDISVTKHVDVASPKLF